MHVLVERYPEQQRERVASEAEWTTYLGWAGEPRATCPEHPL